MSTLGAPAFSPFRVKPRRDPSGAPLTLAQRQVLAALVELCPGAAGDVDARAVAERADLRLGSVVVVLRSLLRRGLVLVHENDPEGWAPTMTGRARARHFPDAHRATGANAA